VNFQSSLNSQALNLFLFYIPKFRKFWDVTAASLSAHDTNILMVFLIYCGTISNCQTNILTIFYLLWHNIELPPSRSYVGLQCAEPKIKVSHVPFHVVISGGLKASSNHNYDF
jgi:hypothetical protein